MKFIKITTLFLTMFAQVNMLQAEWDSRYLPEDHANDLKVLNDPYLTLLEKEVIDYLKNSWCSEEKARLIIELIAIIKPKHCAEVGVFTGSSSLPILSGLKFNGTGITYAIDSWSNQAAIRGLPENDPNTAWWKSLNMRAMKKQFTAMLDKWSFGSICKVIQTTSEKAILQIDEIDFLHLDGNFSEEGALLDSELYLPKVVPGGYVLLSNALVMIGGKATKMKALWPLFDQCDIICEIDHGNALLFRKKFERKINE